MRDWLNQPRSDRGRGTIPVVWAAFALSLVLHAAVLWGWVPRERDRSLESSERGKASGPLMVQLAPEPGPETSPPPPLQSPPLRQAPATKRASPPKPASRPPPKPPVIAREGPAPVAAPPPEPPSAAAPALTPVEGDFSSHLEARRRARGASPPDSTPAPVEDERERHNQIVAANLGLARTPTFGPDPTGGGVFQIQRMTYDAAEFVFFGWNRDIRRNSKQLIEVRKGDNSDIRIAIVRRMIAIIRDNEPGDFVWVSRRLGRNVTLSARPGDSAGLEDFLMEEFFAGTRLRYSH